MTSWRGKTLNGSTTYVYGALPNGCWVPRKPEPKGNERKTACDALTRVMIASEAEEGKMQMRMKEFCDKWQYTTATSLRLVKKWFGSERIVVGDSWFASFMTVA